MIVGENTGRAPETDFFTERLRQSAFRGVIPEGELLEGYLAQRASAAARRTANIAEQAKLLERVAAMEAELEALIFEPPEPVRERVAKSIREISEIIPFQLGGRHG